MSFQRSLRLVTEVCRRWRSKMKNEEAYVFLAQRRRGAEVKMLVKMMDENTIATNSTLPTPDWE
jgi:hypothetical protein